MQSKRHALRALAAGAAVTLAGALLAGCSADGRETIRFTFSKREALEFMNGLVDEYNASQDAVRVEMAQWLLRASASAAVRPGLRSLSARGSTTRRLGTPVSRSVMP